MMTKLTDAVDPLDCKQPINKSVSIKSEAKKSKPKTARSYNTERKQKVDLLFNTRIMKPVPLPLRGAIVTSAIVKRKKTPESVGSEHSISGAP